MSTPRVAVVVNSCQSYYQVAVPTLLQSARVAGIPLTDIYVVVGDAETDIPDTVVPGPEGGYHLIFTRYINIDFNGVMYMTQTEAGRQTLAHYTHFFYVHDTVEFLPHFWERMGVYVAEGEQYIYLLPQAGKNIGLFEVAWFMEHKAGLLAMLANTDPAKKVDYKHGRFENEAAIRAAYPMLPHTLNEDVLVWMNPEAGCVFPNQEYARFQVAKYGGAMRLATVYQEPGLVKYQANWGQSPVFRLDL
jgi:hypothetical protein